MESLSCPDCQGQVVKKHGHTADGRPRHRCGDCRRVWVEHQLPRPTRRARRISEATAVQIVGLACEGTSIRAIQRLTNVTQGAILRLLSDVGEGCERLLEEKLQGVAVADVEMDEMWGYIYCKEATKRRKSITHPDAGDSYLFIAMERNTKAILAHHLGRRTSDDTDVFLGRLARATTGEFQLSSDGFDAYPGAVEKHLGARVNYGQQVKEFGAVGGEEGRRYAPPKLIASTKYWISGEPDEGRVGTSRIERMNWTVRTGLRRYVRLSNGFSRKKANLAAAVNVFICYYNFVKFHKTIRMTPAMKADVTRKPWSVADLFREAEQRRKEAPKAA